MNPFNPISHPNVYEGHDYALQVMSGEIPNCVFVIGACQRYLSDIEKKEFIFDVERAERYLKLTQKFNHVKGKGWKSSNIEYEPWQKFMLMNIMGWIDPRTDEIRFRTAHVEIPRGQGKSCLASQMALYFLALDNPKGNEISCAATKTDQSRIVLDSSRAMARDCPEYLKGTGVEVLAHKIIHAKSNSFIRALSSDSKSLDGLNDVLCIIDELHAVDKPLFEVIYSGLSKRNDSLLFCITTAGGNVEGIGFSQSQYAKKVARGEHIDEQFFSLVYTIDEGDNIFDESTWKKANPNYGVSVDPITFRAKAEKARITPADIANFKTKHLDIWCNEAAAYYDLAAWDKCAYPSISPDQFVGDKCYVGIDLASKVDLTSLVSVFRKEGIYYVFDRTYIPEDTALQASSALYDNCIGSGHLISTPGEAINYSRLEEDFKALSKKHNIISGLFDPWNAVSFSQNMVKERIDMKEFRMNTANLSEATKTLDALIRQKKIVHNGSPLLRWVIGNVVCKEDAAGNVFPKKSSDKLKIDPAVALIMALAAWISEEDTESVYESRGVLLL